MMNRKESNIKRIISCLICVVLTILCWSGGLQLSDRAKKAAKTVGLRYEPEILTHSSLLDIEKMDTTPEQPVPAWAAWVQQDGKSILNEQNSHIAQATNFLIYGNATLVMPGATYLAGYAPDMLDTQGCALSETVAYQLFGSVDVIGKACQIDGREFLVRGVYDLPKDTAILQNSKADESSKISYTGMEISLLSEEQNTLSKGAKEQVQDFVQRFGIATSDVMMDYASRAQWIAQLALLPGWILITVLIFGIIRRGARENRSWMEHALKIILGLGCLAFGLWILQPAGQLPTAYLPSRWSDFEFWATSWQSFAQSISKQNALPGYLPDIMRQTNEYKIFAYTGAAVLCSIPAMRKKSRQHNLSGLCICMAVALISAFIVTVWRDMAFPRALWLIWPLYFAGFYISDELQFENSQLIEEQFDLNHS